MSFRAPQSHTQPGNQYPRPNSIAVLRTTHAIGGRFSDQRQSECTRSMRKKRGTTNGGDIAVGSSGELDEKATFGPPCSQREFADFDAKWPPQAKKWLVMVRSRGCIDQSGPSCSLMSLLNLAMLTGHLDSLSKPVRDWQFWLTTNGQLWANSGESAALDLATTLDNIHNFTVRGTTLQVPAGLTYFPVCANSENMLNPRLAADVTTHVFPKTISEKTRLVGNWFQTRVDAGPLAFNSDNHSRVAVGYDDDFIYCVDSFGADYSEGHQRRYWHNGGSLVCKWVVFNNVRDCMFF